MKVKICIVTGSRAEYGLFYPLLKRIKREPLFQLQIAVCGMHLSCVFGLTYKEIIGDGFSIDERVKIPLVNDTAEGIAKSVGIGVIGFAPVFKRLNPDFAILLGDRFETYSAAIAAFLARIPIIHLYGGELTEGVVDDAFRHSITKMSILHFTSTESYRQRVIQLGEHPRRVFTVGAIGIDNIREMKLLTKPELERTLGFNLGDKSVLVTFHPVTLEHNTARQQFIELLNALDSFHGLKIIFTKSNADTEGRIIIKLMESYATRNPDRAKVFSSLGKVTYLSCLKYVNAVVGNSSSGIIEAPSLGIPTVNIGDRQKGRVRAESVIQCAPVQESIFRALKKAFSLKFNSACIKIWNPYGSGMAARKIVSILKKEIPRVKSLKKEFYDLR